MKFLNAPETLTQEEILLLSRNLDTREMAKIMQDKFYSQLFIRTKSKEALIEAGFFNDNLDNLNYDLNLLTTPWDKINLKIKEGVVLLSTGGFSPVHDGHISMMEQAYQVLQTKGYNVIGGYLSPSHDNYVHTKYEQAKMLTIYQKIEKLREKVKNHEWLMIDPWEGIFTKSSINFTDVISRLSQYLSKHLSINPKMAYVCGADNAGFARAFKGQKEIIVIVNRKGREEYFNKLKQELQDESNIIFVDTHEHMSLASRNLKLETTFNPQSNLPYLVREDLNWSTNLFSKTELTSFSKKIKMALQKSTGLNVHGLNVLSQEKFTSELTSTKNVISLDPIIKTNYNISVSRIFKVADGQYFSQLLINRPHSEVLDQQISKIPPGKYVILEDDVASGFTIEYIKKILPTEIEIENVYTLTEHSFYEIFSQETEFKFFDIVDLRDFLFGAIHGGLVLSLPNQDIFRGIYSLPYVNLSSRAKIRPEKVIELSKAIWWANYELYKDRALFVSDLDEYTQKLCLYMGFELKTKVSEVCYFHWERL